ncbi:manganese/nickel-dependent phosphodiesterase, YfcE family [Syntrophotalea carbinolica DSM 2380]|uniref:Phosphoesterase n=1 Tax=Syntrophotalea carbinolica (strain DSM 2380 / NBRC 103641 / GraBd1) TaxID=338963 RepID=Q3A4F8_SYNC1|nr:metallophosphoesterase [Syntrophotalea carbinolica]ABA88749.1 manganese/nickel-dependent phosphodiesterase, YfcE family [Syntrophotalea carbinolica DSM 2380]
MLKIGVLSDTHIRQAMRHGDFLDALDGRLFRDAEVILHAGDLVDHDLLNIFAPRVVHAVRGNMDSPAVALPVRKVFEVSGFRFGLIHGWGPPEGLGTRVLREFDADSLDCLVYGHSHMPDCRRLNDMLLFNPGSATSPRGGFPPSVGMLEVDDSGIRGRIVSLDDQRF